MTQEIKKDIKSTGQNWEAKVKVEDAAGDVKRDL
jgi:hypothetical protein